ncbi:hypothetical protein Tco_1342500, partial [Tanacetum coccineum]
TMADVNVNAPAEQTPAMAPPTRTDDQILPRSSWYTNFFRAFTASSTILSIYIQQFWDTIQYDKTTGRYNCQLDEQWFDLNKDTLRDALQITPVNNNQSFSSPPTPDALINFVNDLGYPKVVKTLSAVVTNDIEDVGRIHPIHPFFHRRQEESGTAYSGKEESQSYCSPLHLSNEEYVLGYLKFSAMVTKREVFGMPIPNDLITDDIRDGQYYNEYLEKVAKHQRYLAGEEGSDPDSPVPKPAKATKPEATKKSKPSAPKAASVTKPTAAKASKSTSSQQPKPKPAPAKPQEKKRKLVTKTPDEPSLVKSSKRGLVTKKCKPTSSLRLVDESVDKGIPVNEPRFDDEEANMQRAVKESLKDGKRKEKVIEEQGSLDPSESAESKPLPSQGIHTDSSLDHMDEGLIATAYPNVQENLKLPVKEQVILEEPASFTGTLSSLKHLTKDFSFVDQFFNDKPSDVENEKTTAETDAESMVFITIHQDTSAIPPMTSPVIDLISRPDSPNEHQPLPATTTATATTITTITTLPLPPQPQQSTTDSILITHIGELEKIMANLIQDNEHLKECLDSHGSRLYKLENLNIPHQVSKAVDEIVTDVVDWAIQAPLRDRFKDFPEANMKEILHQQMWETNFYKAHEDHKKLYKALEKSMDHDYTDQLLTDLAEARRKKKRRHESPKTPPGSPPYQPPPPPPPASPSGSSGTSGASRSSQLPPPPLPPSNNQSDQSKSTTAPSSSKTAASAEYTGWTTTDTRFKSFVHLSDDEDIGSDHIPKVNLKQDWWKPLPEEERPATPEPAWSILSSNLPVPINNWASALASTYAPPPENSLLAQTCDMEIFMDWYCKK